jgi:ribonuclease R
MSALQRLQEQIIRHVTQPGYRPAKGRQLAKRMGVRPELYGTFRDAIKRLVAESRLVRDRKKLIRLPKAPDRVVGVYRATSRGFGFVTLQPPAGGEDLFIPEGDAADAVSGDTVEVRRVFRGKRRAGDRVHGRVLRVVRRGRTRFVGTLEKSSRGHRIVPDGTPILAEVLLPDASSRARAGEKVVVEISEYPRPNRPARGVIVEVLGRPGEPGVDTTSVVRQYDIPDVFEADVLAEAHAAIEGYDAEAEVAAGRRDLRDEVVVTIDPDDARDYDDAVSVIQTREGWHLAVHIADVAHFVRPGGPLDLEAAERGTSVYFPHRVVPMLPEVLSNGICSLQEAQDRLVKSVFVTFDKTGEVVGADFAESVIRNARRLTYAQAAGVLDGHTDGVPKRVVALLKRMRRLAKLLLARRRRAGMIELQLPEVELVYDENNKVVDAHPEPTDFSHRIIEMFMIEANEAVARLCAERGVPLMRRVHPDPTPEAAEQFVHFAQALGHRIQKRPTRRQMQDLLARVEGKPEAYALNLAMLKSQKRAEYTPQLLGHYALASEHYCHFTSPIRRYPDLTVHRQLAWLLAGRHKRPPASADRLGALAEDCNKTERRAENAVREYKTLKILEMLSERIGDPFPGVVTGLQNFGVFVQSTKFLIEGLLPIEQLGDDFFELDASGSQLIGNNTGTIYRLGDKITAVIDAADLTTRRLRLARKPQSKPAKGGRSTGGPRRGRRRQRQ